MGKKNVRLMAMLTVHPDSKEPEVRLAATRETEDALADLPYGTYPLWLDAECLVRTSRAKVRVGQVWEDTDPRSYGREVVVIEVEDDRARVQAVDHRGHRYGRRTWVSIDRLLNAPKNRGYELREDSTP